MKLAAGGWFIVLFMLSETNKSVLCVSDIFSFVWVPPAPEVVVV